MGVLTHAVTYQGYPCTAVAFRRSAGLSPEYGYVDIDLAVLKKISILARDIPWRPANEGLNIPAQLAIDAWKKLTSGTVNAPPALAAPKGGGLNRFGDLVLYTYDDGVEIQRQTYVDVFVHDAGIEEITRGLANARAHTEGTVRVPLTDIRQFYPEHGAFCQRINCRLRTGEFDKATLFNDKPWSAQDVIRYMFSQLPGSPIVVSGGFDGQKYAPPTDLVGEGDPMLQFLQRLLEQMGLVALLQPDNNYAVVARLSDAVPYGKYAPAVGSLAEAKYQGDETKSVWISNRPPMVQVFGKRRIRRKTMPYVPIFRNVDGRYYRLKDIAQVWGYHINQVKKNRFIAPQKSFRDVPPNDFSQLHHKRRKLIREWAYRGYAPSAYFQTPDGATAGGKPPSFTDDDAEKLYFLPMREAPYYVSDLENLGVEYPQGQTPQTGDKGKFVLIPPVVTGKTVGQSFFRDIDEVTRYFNKIITEDNRGVKDLRTKLLVAQNELNVIVQKSLATALDMAKFRNQVPLDISVGIVDYKDMGLAENDMGVPSSSAKTAEALQAKAKYLDGKRKIQEQIISDLQEQLNEASLEANTWNAKYNAFKDVFAKRKGIQAWMNLAYGVVAPGSYSLDERTGIVMFSEPFCSVENPFWLDGDDVTVLGDGSVNVSFGYELNENTTGDFTSFLFCVGGEPPLVSLCGMNRSSPIAAKAERVPNMRLYESDLGTPFNFTQCYTDAVARAYGQQAIDGVVDGYSYVYDGLLQAVLDGATSTIQHEWSIKAKGLTHISVGAPNARGPLGPAWLAGDVKATGQADARWAIEAAKNE
jgi:hypothetical protein